MENPKIEKKARAPSPLQFEGHCIIFTFDQEYPLKFVAPTLMPSKIYISPD